MNSILRVDILDLLKLSRQRKIGISLCTDFLSFNLAFWLSFLLFGGFSGVNAAAFLISIAISSVTVALMLLAGAYRSYVRYEDNKVTLVVFVGVLTSSILVFLSLKAVGHVNAMNTAVLYGFISVTLMHSVRLIFRLAINHAEAEYHSRVLIYGAGAAGVQLINALRASNHYTPVAFVDDDPGLIGTSIMGYPVHSSTKIGQLVSKYSASKILLAIPSANRSRRREIITGLQNICDVEIKTMPGMNDFIEGNVQLGDIRSVSVEDLLGREPVAPIPNLISANISGKNVFVTGAGGSIGSELCRQIILQEPRTLVLYELSEFGLYAIHSELLASVKASGKDINIVPLLGTVQNKHRMYEAMKAFSIQTVYHAAAYKHVPMVEYNVVEGVRNNVFGTWYAAEAAIEAEVERFVLVSTDKAVRPTNVMGTTKRCAELVCQGLAERQRSTTITMVRFGNVLGSSGSVVPLFKKQIEAGGPITVTHRDITRYFMTIPEAAQLVIQAGAMARAGEVYVLDMGDPVKIYDLAKQMIRLSGLSLRNEKNPDGDIAIDFTGLRPGEKLYEELLIGDNATGTNHPRINTAQEGHLNWESTVALINNLDRACVDYHHEEIRKLLLEAPTEFNPTDEIGDLVWHANKAKSTTAKLVSMQ